MERTLLKDEIKKKLKLLIILLILIPLVNALTITNTTFHSSVSNYTIHVDSITLDNVTVTNLTIEFYNLTSGNRIENINDTFNATINFINLGIGLQIINLNTSSILFISTINNQDFNATFSTGQIISIQSLSELRACSNFEIIIFPLIVLLSVVALLAFVANQVTEIKGRQNNKLTIFLIGTIIAIIAIRIISEVLTCG